MRIQNTNGRLLLYTGCCKQCTASGAERVNMLCVGKIEHWKTDWILMCFSLDSTELLCAQIGMFREFQTNIWLLCIISKSIRLFVIKKYCKMQSRKLFLSGEIYKKKLSNTCRFSLNIFFNPFTPVKDLHIHTSVLVVNDIVLTNIHRLNIFCACWKGFSLNLEIHISITKKNCFFFYLSGLDFLFAL